MRKLRGKDSESGAAAAAAAAGCLRTQLSRKAEQQNGSSSMLAERLEKNAPRPRENPRERKLRKNSGSRW